MQTSTENDQALMEVDFPADPVENSHAPFMANPVTFSRPRGGASSYEQRFLLYFILGAYFGPDVTSEVPRKSALQRESEGLPPYTLEQLGGCVLRLSDIENIYYFLLRNCHPSYRVKLQSLYKYLQGHLAPPLKKVLDDDRQFPSFFPPTLHKHSRYKGTYKVVENLVFIENPDASGLKPEDLDTFRRLTNMQDLAIDKQQALSYHHGLRHDRDEERSARYNPSAYECLSPAHAIRPATVSEPLLLPEIQRKKQKKEQQGGTGAVEVSPSPPLRWEDKPSLVEGKIGAALLLLPSLPTWEQWNDITASVKPALSLTGTVATCQSGPSIGLVDIYQSDDAYLFRCSLPGVKKQENDFTCQVEGDGKVTIKGCTTTGESKIHKDSRVFTSLFQSLAQPGPFSVSFYLPGPVEPHTPTANFRNDGILEGLVLKQRPRVGTASLTFES